LQRAGATLEASVLAQARATLIHTDSDSGYYNGSVDYYTLALEVPVATYARIEDERTQLEESIGARVAALLRTQADVRVNQVVIGPEMTEDEAQHVEGDEAVAAPPAFWEAGRFRLFLSHPSQVKKGAHELKAALARYDIAAFVAHDDIEPTREWQAEIESALRTMDALAAIVTPDFVNSRWCDQEVGVAIGRGKLVVPLRAGADPHGFLGKYQGLQISKVAVGDIARMIVEALVKNSASSPRMCDVLVERMEKAISWSSAKSTMDLLELAPRLGRALVARLVATIDGNAEVREAFGVPERIRALVARAGEPDAA
jgi:hypothetical protein